MTRQKINIESNNENIHYFNSIDDILQYIKINHQLCDNIFVIGGAAIYNEFINRNLCDYIYVTKINGSFKCDTFFPIFEKTGKYELIDADKNTEIQYENNIDYQYMIYKKKNILNIQ